MPTYTDDLHASIGIYLLPTLHNDTGRRHNTISQVNKRIIYIGFCGNCNSQSNFVN